MTEDNAIDLTRLGEGLDAYGGDFRRWPQGLRAAAEALVARDQAARRLRETALALDALLDQAPSPLPSRALKARIMRPVAPPLWRQLLAALWPLGPAWQPAAALVLLAAIGIAIGPYVGGDEPATSEIEVLAFGGLQDYAGILRDDGGDLP